MNFSENTTFVRITGGAAVVRQAVSVWQEPACRAVGVAVAGATTSEIPDEYVPAGALCDC